MKLIENSENILLKKCQKTIIAAGSPPQTPLRELILFIQTPIWCGLLKNLTPALGRSGLAVYTDLLLK